MTNRQIKGIGAAILAVGFMLAPGTTGNAVERTTPPAIADADLLRAYLPKEDLGVTRFLAAHPDADGRGVIVAVLDTGIDLHHPGLLLTPGGERKILDVYDATDDGLVELPIQVTTRDTTLIG